MTCKRSCLNLKNDNRHGRFIFSGSMVFGLHNHHYQMRYCLVDWFCYE